MKSPEELLTRAMNALAEKLKGKLVLKGGMLLRRYQSPRSTQDVDFVLLTKESKKKWGSPIVKTLEGSGIKVSKIELNSRGIFIDIEDETGDQKAQVEVDVRISTHLRPEPMTTATLSKKYKMGGRVISAMAVPEAFSNKIAAALERRAVRDLYDLSQLETMGAFDVKTLEERFSRLTVERGKPRKVSVKEGARMLRERLEDLDQKKIEQDLHPLLPIEFRPGVLGVIWASVSRIAQRM
ncbi:MAG: nucleotidyl transferase AbiEii/AbiGii toxin family protein, partial [Deltaproteobacteria bacterium]|nr:nucleotidyl transferase AbiEii/AbiGii toxin family protein [Deltaproteobacteria bacterium]